MAHEDLEGTAFGRYRVAERLGEGSLSVVYRATDRELHREVALKVLDPAVSARPGFLPRYRATVHNLARAGDPGILTVYDAGRERDLTYVTVRLVRGVTLAERLAGGPLDFPTARALIRVIGQAVHSAHEAGVLHQDLKPSNVLLEDGKAVQVADFGLAPLRYGYALGTPGSMSPEQATGQETDRRSDVHALAQLVFEMVTGRRPYAGETPPELMVATVGDPVPSARELDPDLPPELDEVLARGLAKDPRDRPSTAAQLLEELERVPAGTGRHAGVERELLACIDATPGPVLALDPDGRVTHWNRGAEVAFGWTREAMVGQVALTRLIATAHRERFEHLVQEVLRSPAQEPAGHSVDVEAAHRDGHPVALAVSLSPLPVGDGRTDVVVFCRDVSSRRESDRLARMQATVARLLSERPPPEQLVPRMLEAMCTSLGWSAAAVWRPDAGASRLRCLSFWHAPALAAEGAQALGAPMPVDASTSRPGLAWATGRQVWEPDLGGEAPSERDRTTLGAGLRATGAFPISEGGRVVAVLEVFAPSPGSPGSARLTAVQAVARQLGEVVHHLPGDATRRVRYRLDARNTQLGFSCAFMKLLTVHGLFHDFSGWVELDGEDPTTARAECTIKTASVDTGSVDRDWHLCSPEFFAVERYPDMRFRSTEVEALGDERFRLFGELTIRDVTRPLRLDVRLEDRDAAGDRVTLTAGTTINRLDWFLDWERALQAGRWIVGDDVRLDLVITLVRRPAVPEQVYGRWRSEGPGGVA